MFEAQNLPGKSVSWLFFDWSWTLLVERATKEIYWNVKLFTAQTLPCPHVFNKPRLIQFSSENNALSCEEPSVIRMSKLSLISHSNIEEHPNWYFLALITPGSRTNSCFWEELVGWTTNFDVDYAIMSWNMVRIWKTFYFFFYFKQWSKHWKSRMIWHKIWKKKFQKLLDEDDWLRLYTNPVNTIFHLLS